MMFITTKIADLNAFASHSMYRLIYQSILSTSSLDIQSKTIVLWEILSILRMRNGTIVSRNQYRCHKQPFRRN